MSHFTLQEWQRIVRENEWREIIDAECKFIAKFYKPESIATVDNMIHGLEIKELCPLYLEVCNGNLEIVNLMLHTLKINIPNDFQVHLNRSLCAAVKAENIEMVKYLVQQGADVNTGNAFCHDIPIIVSLCQDHHGHEDICLELTKKLVENGAVQLTDALRGASYQYRISVMKYLIEHGADPRAYFVLTSPLTRAGFEDQYKVVKLLLEHGADPNDVNPNQSLRSTPLVWATFHRSPRTVKLLLEYGADPDLESQLVLEASTALHTASQRRIVSIVALLIHSYCDVNKTAKIRTSRRDVQIPRDVKKTLFRPLESVNWLEPDKEYVTEITYLLVSAGSKVESDWLTYSTNLDGYDNELYNIIKHTVEQPYTLKKTCKLLLRRLAKEYNEYLWKKKCRLNSVSFVQGLPLPDVLRRYVDMSHELDPWIKNICYSDG